MAWLRHCHQAQLHKSTVVVALLIEPLLRERDTPSERALNEVGRQSSTR
jgi:hypothetical protein